MKSSPNNMTKLRNALFTAVMLITATNAMAHVDLSSSTPAMNASITTAPKSLVLNFSGEVMLMNIKLLDAQRTNIPLNYKVNHDLKKIFNVPVPELKKGKYFVVWTTMGKDGHNMNNEYSFTIK